MLCRLILQVLRGSHKCGRVDHSFVAGQTGIDKERLKHLMDRYEKIYVEMEPGKSLLTLTLTVTNTHSFKSHRLHWNIWSHRSQPVVAAVALVAETNVSS